MIAGGKGFASDEALTFLGRNPVGLHEPERAGAFRVDRVSDTVVKGLSASCYAAAADGGRVVSPGDAPMVK